jgi:uncharacterized protein YndB with AHSA1/START domain
MSKSNQVIASIQIDAPPETVWNVLMDPGRLREWVTIHRRLGKAAGSPLKAGDELDQTLCLRGVNFKVHWTVEEADEPHRAVWEGRGPARSKARTVYEVSPNGNGTKFRYVNEFNAPMGPLGSVASRVLMGGGPQREANASLQRLKKLLESR